MISSRAGVSNSEGLVDGGGGGEEAISVGERGDLGSFGASTKDGGAERRYMLSSERKIPLGSGLVWYIRLQYLSVLWVQHCCIG